MFLHMSLFAVIIAHQLWWWY